MKGILGAAAVQGFPNIAFANTGPRIRLEWEQFKETSQYQSFRNAIAAMRLNTNPNDRGSLHYWVRVHQTYCPHDVAYFISWHRGYLYYFEQQLRISSGDPTLDLPYWNYYSYATLPSEFTDPAPDNPLYLERAGANVHNALSLSPFAPEVYNFQHGTTNSFEVKIESAPHNPVHNLIGGIMSTMQSPFDPIFYLHHASIDRLTHAWALPDGKGIPGTANPYSSTNSSAYWAGSNIYAPQLSIERYRTYYPGWLGYDYADNTVPTSLPAASETSTMSTMSATSQTAAKTTQSSSRAPSRRRPPFKQFTRAPGRQISAARRSLGGAAQIGFDEQSYSTALSFSKKDAAELAAIIAARRAGQDGAGDGRVGSIKLVVDGARLSELGRRGGYFYALYLNMPPVVESGSANDRFFLGTLGAFEIAAASHHGPAKLEFDLVGLLLQQKIEDFSNLSLSWLRVDGDHPPVGRTINAHEARIDLSYEARPVLPPPKEVPGQYR
jgi:tyrosinase